MGKILFPAGDMRASNPKFSGAMKKLLKNPKIAKVLDKPKEKADFYKEMKKYGAGGVTKEEMAKVLWKFKSSGGDSLDYDETRRIGQAVLGSGVGASARYIDPSEEKKNNKISKAGEKDNRDNERKTSNVVMKNKKGDSSAKESLKENKGDEGKTNIYEALRNVKHNKD